jgi:hypothetical protein
MFLLLTYGPRDRLALKGLFTGMQIWSSLYHTDIEVLQNGVYTITYSLTYTK